MLFWIIAAVLTLGASIAVLLPLSGRLGSRAEGKDIEVYRDQLAEIDRDMARGLIRSEEAEQARAEIARRIIRANAEEGRTSSRSSLSARVAATAAVLAVPVVSWGIYGMIGSPGLPSQPLQERLTRDPSQSTESELIARAEQHLAANPDDGRGWDVLAPVYLRLGRFDDAVIAYRNAIRLLGPTAHRHSGLGEAIVSAAGGLVTDEAQDEFRRALQLEAGNLKARYFLAAGLAQEGQLAEAQAGWKAMLPDLPAASPWRVAVEQAIAQADSRMGAAKETAGTDGPSQQDMEEAAKMAPADRAAMIETMVAGLDEKLRSNPHDVEGWKRLMRSYVVLGRRDAAMEALGRARSALGADSKEAGELTTFATSLGLQATE